MNFKTTYILFGVLVGVVGLFVAVTLFRPETEDQTDYVFPSITKDKIKNEDFDHIEIVRGKERLVLERRGPREWWFVSPKVRADNTLVNAFLTDVMRNSKENKAVLSDDLKKWGLDPPRATVTVSADKGKRSWLLNIGDESGGGESSALVYVTSSDRKAGKEVLDVRKRSVEQVFKGPKALRAKDLLTEGVIDFRSAVKSLSLKGPKNEVELERVKDDQWKFKKPPYGDADAEGELIPGKGRDEEVRTGVNGLLSTVGSLKVADDEDFVADDVKDMAPYELEKDKAPLRIEVERKASNDPSDDKNYKKFVLLIGKEDPAAEKGKDGKKKYFARMEDENSVVRVLARDVDNVRKVLDNPEPLRNRDLAQIDKSKVDAIDIDLGKAGRIKLRRLGSSLWKLYEPGKITNVDSDAVNLLLDGLNMRRQIVGFPAADTPDDKLGLDKPAAVVSIWEEGIKKDEPKKEDDKDKDKPDEKKDDPTAEPTVKEKPTYRLVYGGTGKEDGKDVVWVRREVGDQSTRLAAPKARLDDATRDRLAYFDRQLLGFDPKADVVRLEIQRPDGLWIIDKEKPTDPKAPAVWRVRSPKLFAGRQADSMRIDDLIRTLSNLRAAQLVAERASDSDLDRYGLLKQPRYKLTLVIRKGEKETEDRVYLIGNPDKSVPPKYYAKQAERDLVFMLHNRDVEEIAGELLNPVVLSLVPSKVTGIRMEGWQDGKDSPTTIELARKPGQSWTVVKSSAKLNLNDTEVDAFLADLCSLRAERFIDPGGDKLIDPTGKQLTPRLAIENGGLQVTLTSEGEKEPVVVTLGGPDPDKKLIYARCSKLPGILLLVSKDRFEKFKAKPQVFSKE